MHSFIVKSALAAFVLSTSLVGAQATPGSTSKEGASNAGKQAQSMGGHSQSLSKQARSRSASTFSHSDISNNVNRELSSLLDGRFGVQAFTDFNQNTIGDNGKEPAAPSDLGFTSPGYTILLPGYRHAMVHGVSTTNPRHHQRLAHVMGELGATNHRIAVDSRRGYLTASETARVRHEERTIRHAANRTADANGGVLPRKSYERLLADIHSLNRQIHHYATA